MSKLRESQLNFISQSEKLQSVKSNVPSINDRIQKLKPIHCIRQFKKSVKLRQVVNTAKKVELTSKQYKPSQSSYVLPKVVRFINAIDVYKSNH